MQKIVYEIENRDALFAQLRAGGKAIVEDVTIDFVNGRLINCFVIVDDAPPMGTELLAAADERILALEYENLILKEGLA